VPLVVTGFEPVDLLEGLLMLVRQLENGRAEVENQYVRAVEHDGNTAARAVVADVFETCDRAWRGIGTIEKSGLRLRDAYRRYDAEVRFPREGGVASESEICIAGDVLRGRAKPNVCSAYGTLCTPETPLGAPMVSSEGACAAYFLAGREREQGVRGAQEASAKARAPAPREEVVAR
jgi:hydrogenase expression/formation protein HypD